MDYLTVGKKEYEIADYSTSEENLLFRIKTEDAKALADELTNADSVVVHRYAENDGRKGELYISEEHYGYKPQNIVTNYTSGETMITMAKPTITIKGVANINKVMTLLEEAGYKIEEKELQK